MVEVQCDTIEDARKAESIFTTKGVAMSGLKIPMA
jgi:hypothetical protein